MKRVALLQCTSCRSKLIYVFFWGCKKPGYTLDRRCLKCGEKTSWIVDRTYFITGDRYNE